MVVNFASVDYTEQPTLILKNAGCTPIGVLGYAIHVTPDIKYNEVSSLEFELPAYVDGEAVPFYKEVIGMRVIEVVGLGQFILTSPTETGDGVTLKKTCKAYSLEFEFSYKKLSLPQETYKFWDSLNPENTLLGIIMEYMPSWHVGTVSNSLTNKYRTFEVNNENVYNFIKNTIQQAYNCIFDFDTMTRTVNVRSVSDEASSRPVFISLGNLATQIEITEETEDIITRIDVNGAEGIDIRDVNPTGTNKIINLDYFMTPANFSQELIDKYFAWQKLCEDKAEEYYTLSVRYALAVTQNVAEGAKLTDLKGEKSTLENTLGTNLSAQAQGLATQERIDEINAQIAAKQEEIDAQQQVIDDLKTQMEDIMTQLTNIKNQCNYDKYFTKSERIEMDKYMKDGDVSESSFVAEPNGSYSSDSSGGNIANKEIHILNSVVTSTTDAAGRKIYTAKGGNFNIGENISAELISAVLEDKENKIVLTAYLNSGEHGEESFDGACITITGTSSSSSSNETELLCTVSEGYMYFTQDVSEFQKRSVAWDLYEFGKENLAKLCVPTYTFTVSSANFFALDEFITFRDQLRLGEKSYIELPDETVLEPICIGANFTYDDPNSLTLQFSDSYVSGNSQFRLVDLLEESVSTGKNVELSKYSYASFKDSGADTEIRRYMDSALDLAKQAIMSSTNQAITFDQAGLRLRKYINEAQTDYEDEQIWMNNNSILMTSDGWAHAVMAIGKFHDENAGDCWGIVADRVMGTLIAGSNLIIESQKKDGQTAVFRMDGEGCRLYNADFNVSKTNSAGKTNRISISPTSGIAIGVEDSKNKLFKSDGSINEDAGRMWIDMNGNMHLKGAVVATSLHIQNGNKTQDISDYVIDTAFNSDEYGDILERVSTCEFEVTADQIMAKVTASTQYQDLTERMTTAELQILPDAIISTVTSSTEYQTLSGTVTDLGTEINGDYGLKSRMTSAEQKITPEAITNTVTSSETYQLLAGTVGGLDTALNGAGGVITRLSTAEQKITAEAIVNTVTTSTAYQGLAGEVSDLGTAINNSSTGILARLDKAEQKITAEAIVSTVTSSKVYKDITDDIDDLDSALNDSKTGVLVRLNSAEQKITAEAIVSTVTKSEAYVDITDDIKDLDDLLNKANTGVLARLTSAEQKITADAIVSTVTKSETYKALDDSINNSSTGVIKRLTTAEQKITPDQITLTVTQSDEFKGVKSATDTYSQGVLSNSSLAINTGGIAMSGGAITIKSGVGFYVQSGGLVTIDADSDNSYIRFGGTAENPNFLLGKQGTVKAVNGHFGSITVDDMSIMQSVAKSLTSKIFVGTTKPTTGSGYVWLKPSAVSSVDYTAHPTTAIYMNGTNPTGSVAFTHQGDGILGTQCKYGVRLKIYNYEGTPRTTRMTVKIQRANGTGNQITIVNNVSVGYVGLGDYFIIDTLDTPTALLENITDTEAINVIVTLSKGDTSKARFEYGDFILRCTGSSSAAEQNCSVIYVS